MLTKIVIVLVAFALGVGLATIFGAKNLGTALGVGQIAFVLALVYVLIVRRPDGEGGSTTIPKE